MRHEPSQQFETPREETLEELERRGEAEAEALIGDDPIKGLAEVRRLKATALACYAASSRHIKVHMELFRGRLGDESRAAWKEDADAVAAELASDQAGHHYHYALFHMLRLPIRSVKDIAAKTTFAAEEADYTTDEDFKAIVLDQIVSFFQGGSEQSLDTTRQPQATLQAAE